MFNSKTRTNLLASLLGLAIFSLSATAFADSGAFIGGSVGTASVSVDDGFGESFDEDDFAWKVYGGYAFDLPVVDFGLEIGYFDLGSAEGDLLGEPAGVSVSGYEAFGLIGFNLGPVGIFGKAGIAAWDADVFFDALDERGSVDGSDPAYGVGLRFMFGSLEFRGEYEVIDIAEAEDVYMATLGLVWRF
jgi:outer membrane immunogenic protein